MDVSAKWWGWRRYLAEVVLEVRGGVGLRSCGALDGVRSWVRGMGSLYGFAAWARVAGADWLCADVESIGQVELLLLFTSLWHWIRLIGLSGAVA